MLTGPSALVLGLIAGVAGLLAWGRLRPDVVALLLLVALGLTGLVPPRELFRGFSRSAVVTIP